MDTEVGIRDAALAHWGEGQERLFFELLGHSIATALLLISQQLSPAAFEGIASLWALPFDGDEHWVISNGAWVSHTCIFSFGRSTVGAGWRIVQRCLRIMCNNNEVDNGGWGSILAFHPIFFGPSPVMEQVSVVLAFTP